MSQTEKSSVPEMIGELLRELAVLIFVFVPLELWKGSQTDMQEFSLVLVGTVVLSILLLAGGIVVERMRSCS